MDSVGLENNINMGRKYMCVEGWMKESMEEFDQNIVCTYEVSENK